MDQDLEVTPTAPAPEQGVAAFDELVRALRAGRGHEPEAAAAAQSLAAEGISTEAKAKFLFALEPSLWTATVLAEFAKVFRACAVNPHVEAWSGSALDVCGTGGDHSGSFNISTAVAFVAAAGGVPVFKHGNRSITSQSGSADFLEKLGIPLEAPGGVWRSSLRELNFAFFFAPAYHPAFKQVAPARKALAAQGQRTVFNILGPLLNPGRPMYQLVGVYDFTWSRLLAASLETLGVRRGLVVHGQTPGKDAKGFDELSTVHQNVMTGVGELRFLDAATLRPRPAASEGEIYGQDQRDVIEFAAERFALPRAEPGALAGGDAARNVIILEALLAGRAPEGLRDTVILNAGAALWVAKKAGDLSGGIAQARDLLASGKVAQWLQRAREFFRDTTK